MLDNTWESCKIRKKLNALARRKQVFWAIYPLPKLSLPSGPSALDNKRHLWDTFPKDCTVRIHLNHYTISICKYPSSQSTALWTMFRMGKCWQGEDKQCSPQRHFMFKNRQFCCRQCFLQKGERKIFRTRGRPDFSKWVISSGLGAAQ